MSVRYECGLHTLSKIFCLFLIFDLTKIYCVFLSFMMVLRTFQTFHNFVLFLYGIVCQRSDTNVKTIVEYCFQYFFPMSNSDNFCAQICNFMYRDPIVQNQNQYGTLSQKCFLVIRVIFQPCTTSYTGGVSVVVVIIWQLHLNLLM